DLLKKLCELDAPSGSEGKVRDFILNEIKDYAECSVDSMGNIIAFKKGARTPAKRIMIDAHMDEVGFIVTSVDDGGYLRFTTLGGINPQAIVGRRVRFVKDGTIGVVGVKPVHLCSADEKGKALKLSDLYIDIGATDKEQALSVVELGDSATFEGGLEEFGDGKLCGKAIDDRAGCAVLIEMIKSELPYDMYFTFTVQEELGTRGAKTATFSVAPDCAIVVEATTAADISGVEPGERVCELGGGAAISFMDRSTIYNKELFDLCLKTGKEKGIKAQVKAAVAGGNNSGAVHLSRGGVLTLSVSVPCRYLHTASCVIAKDDLISVADIVRAMAEKMLEA
ncbi:MAG: M42 family metallopeptidase, partial [Clostridia bacterium]|nr:M42 family metallopeptidase [Clostridia bacterium]